MASKATIEKVNKTAYGRDLRNIVKDLAGMSQENGLDVRKVADAAHVAPTTIQNLVDGITVFPTFRVLWCWTAAWKFDLGIVEPDNGKTKNTDVLGQAGLRRKKKKKGGKK